MHRRSQLRLIAAFLGLLSPAALRAAEVAGVYVIGATDDRFGGLSGLELSDDGTRFHALSDKAFLFTGRLSRNDRGAVTGLTIDSAVALQGADGAGLTSDWIDAEGLALAPDGRLFVTFELEHRLGEYQPDGSLIRTLPAPRDVFGLERNSGLEALSIAPDGTLYALAEGTTRGWADRPVYRLRDGAWSVAFTLPRADYFRPVGADIGPDGRLYLLERDFWGLLGFRSRLRRITFDDSGFVADELLWETRLGDHSNLEGIALWQDTGGRLRATLIADNNFTALVANEILDLVLPD